MVKYGFGLVLFLFASCTNDSESDLLEPTTPESVVKYAQVKIIIDNNCVSCHGINNPNAGLSLTNFTQTRNAIQNNGLIDRITRLEGDPLLMPTTGRLNQNSINTIINWSDNGFQE